MIWIFHKINKTILKENKLFLADWFFSFLFGIGGIITLMGVLISDLIIKKYMR